MTTPRLIPVCRAVCRVLLDGSSVLPTPTLTAPGTPGDLSVAMTDVRPYLEGTFWSVWDQNPERCAVASTNPSGQRGSSVPVPGTVTFNPATPLRYAHASGPLCSVNLFAEPPMDIAASLDDLWPVIAVYPRLRTETQQEAFAYEGSYQVELDYMLPYNQPPPTYTDVSTQIYHGDVVARADADTAALLDALKRNDRLSVDGTEYVDYYTSFQADLSSATLDDSGAVPVWLQTVTISFSKTATIT